jgi:hypothetical protein
MTDLVAIAVKRRQALRAEVESLDRFIGTAEWLLHGRGKNAVESRRPASISRPVAEPRETGRATEAGEKPGQAQTNDRAASTEPSLSGEWGVDTFHFEAAANGS